MIEKVDPEADYEVKITLADATFRTMDKGEELDWIDAGTPGGIMQCVKTTKSAGTKKVTITIAGTPVTIDNSTDTLEITYARCVNMDSMKRAFVLLLILSGTYIFAKDNRVFAGINGSGVTIAYERLISEKFSVVAEADASLAYGLLASVLFADVRGRFYPFARSFYADFGVGYGLAGSFSLSTKGMLFSPGFGWKIDMGKPDGFVFDVCLSSDWIVKLTNEPDVMYDGPEPYSYPRIYSPIFGIKLLVGYCF
ncbi:hypothetical protein FACS189444_6820 [Spirochaetia bacterium]|nr:hypothetical protein FACS189444_6820 [Spirochaetia bacterium]